MPDTRLVKRSYNEIKYKWTGRLVEKLVRDG